MNLNFNRNQVLTAAAFFVLGAGLTLACTGWRGGDRDGRDNWRGDNIPQGMHQMPNGQMMPNNQAMQNGGMQGMMMNMTAGMQGKTGADLEKAFLTEMVPHHQGAVDMAKMLLASTSTPENLRNFAQQIITAQEAEIKQMGEWLKSY
jgi:uncharacterized protein (DUF305 family)